MVSFYWKWCCVLPKRNEFTERTWDWTSRTTNEKYVESTATLDKPSAAANTPPTKTDATACTTAATTCSTTRTTNECIFVHTVKVCRKVRQKCYHLLSLLEVFFKFCFTIVSKFKWIVLLLSLCFCPLYWFSDDCMGSRSKLVCLIKNWLYKSITTFCCILFH